MNSTLLLAGLFMLELLIIFFISRRLISSLGKLFMKITKSHSLTVRILAILFLPGTILHELSHMLTAGVLLVPVGEMEFMPEVDGDQVKLGSVRIGKTDPFRRIIIGVAPLIFGLAAIAGLVYFNSDSLLHFSPLWLSMLVIYLIFQITNTMFSSKKDLEGTLIFLGALLAVFLLIILTLVLTNRMPDLSWFANLNFQPLTNFFSLLNKFLLIPLVVDLAVFGGLKLII